MGKRTSSLKRYPIVCPKDVAELRRIIRKLNSLRVRSVVNKPKAVRIKVANKSKRIMLDFGTAQCAATVERKRVRRSDK
jgi:hypothetical protein